MKATHTAAAILAAAAIFLSPVAASALTADDTPANDGAVEAPVTAPVENKPIEGKASVETLPDAKVVKAAPDEAKVPEVVAPVETVPEPQPVVADQTKGRVLYLSQLPACDAGDGTVTSGGVPVNACLWAGSFVAIR